MPQPTETIAALNAQHAIPQIAEIIETSPGVAAVRITTKSCTATMHLHGAQITSWQPPNTPEVIFMSSKATFAEGKAIRGGIPICFPWFRAKSDDANAPAHGFVRTKNWALESIQQQGENVAVTMRTASDDSTKKYWPHDFRLQLRATFGAELKLELTVTNLGATECSYSEALHTYYNVGEISAARIQGLANAVYLDNTDGNKEKQQAGEVAISKATDSAYINNESALTLIDPILKRRIRIQKQNSHTTVVWNPWKEAAEKMSDMGQDEWKKMLCAEGANILANSVVLQPGATHTTTVMMTVAPL
jgi:glucose-6-phosphate 1-epimerase